MAVRETMICNTFSLSFMLQNVFIIIIISVLPSGRTLAYDSCRLPFPSLFFWLGVAWDPAGTPMLSAGRGIPHDSSPSKGRARLMDVFWLSCMHASLGIHFSVVSCLVLSRCL